LHVYGKKRSKRTGQTNDALVQNKNFLTASEKDYECLFVKEMTIDCGGPKLNEDRRVSDIEKSPDITPVIVDLNTDEDEEQERLNHHHQRLEPHRERVAGLTASLSPAMSGIGVQNEHDSEVIAILNSLQSYSKPNTTFRKQASQRRAFPTRRGSFPNPSDPGFRSRF
jgi:hypothetical protein